MNALRRIIGHFLFFVGWLTARAMRLVYVVSVTLIAVLVWLLFTTSGADWLAQRAMNEEPRLALQVEGGSLWNGLEVSAVGWSDEGIEVRAQRAELRWNPLCLLALQVCAGLAHVDDVDVAIDTELLADPGADPDDAPGDPREPMERLDLPVSISLPDVVLNRVSVRVDDMHFGWRQLSLGAALRGDRLDVSHLHWLAPYGELPPPEIEEPAATVAEEELPGFFPPGEREPIVLPEIPLPVDVMLDDLRIRDARFTRGGIDEHLPRLDLQAELHGRDLRVYRLSLEHGIADADLEGTLRLDGEWPLDLDLDARIHDAPEVGSVDLRLSAANSLEDLELRLDAAGPATLRLAGRVSPLDPLLPHDLELAWEGLRWPLEGEPVDVASRDGKLRSRGDLDGFRFALEVALEGDEIPAGDWRAEGAGDWSRVDLQALTGDVLGGGLELAGSVEWAAGLGWDLRLALDDLQPVAHWPEAPETVSGRITSRGQWDDGDLTLDAVIEEFSARVQGFPVSASGDVSHRPERGWSVRDLGVRSDGNQVVLDGTVTEDSLEVSADIDVADLGNFLPDAAGRIQGRVAASGALLEPDVVAGIRARGLRYQDLLEVAELDLEADIRRLALEESRLDLSIGALETAQADARVDSLALQARGSRAGHALEIDLEGEPANLALRIAGALDEEQWLWSGELERLGLLAEAFGVGLDLEDPAAVDVAIMEQRARVGPHCWRHEDARLCAPEPLELAEAGEARFTLEGYQLASLATWLPDEVALLGELNGEFGASWSPGGLPRGDASFAVTDGRVLLEDEEHEEVLELDYETLEASVRLDDEALDASLRLDSTDIGTTESSLRVSVVDGAFRDLDGEVSLRGLNLDVAQPFFLELRQLQGEITADGRLSGTLQAPRFDGSLRLSDGTVETVALPVTISDIGILVEVAGDTASLSGGFRSGRGTAEITGEADWSDPQWNAAINLAGQRLELAYDTIATVEASPDLSLSLEPGQARLSGEIRIPRGEITVQDLPEGAVRVSGDVVIIDDDDDVEEVAIEEEAFDVDELPVADGWVVTSDIEIIIGDRVELSAFGLTGRLEGQLGIRQAETGAPQAGGEIRIVDGEYRAYGQRLRIREGQILFSGPVDRPQLFVEAVRQVSRPGARTVVAGLRLEGPPDDPRVSLFSDPPMEEDMILAYIILGRPLGEEGPGGEQVVARAALALGIAGGGGFATGIAEGVGIQDFELDTEGDGDDTQFVVRGRLSPNLYVSYGVGVFQAENTLTLRYRLTQQLYLEAVSGLENALDLLYTFEF